MEYIEEIQKIKKDVQQIKNSLITVKNKKPDEIITDYEKTITSLDDPFSFNWTSYDNSELDVRTAYNTYYGLDSLETNRLSGTGIANCAFGYGSLFSDTSGTAN